MRPVACMMKRPSPTRWLSQLSFSSTMETKATQPKRGRTWGPVNRNEGSSNKNVLVLTFWFSVSASTGCGGARGKRLVHEWSSSLHTASEARVSSFTARDQVMDRSLDLRLQKAVHSFDCSCSRRDGRHARSRRVLVGLALSCHPLYATSKDYAGISEAQYPRRVS